MTLSTYNTKRDFKATPEPKGRKGKSTGQSLAFVVQKHAARRLHYDFRLEMDGVLKSWAVTRGPSLVPSEKRLAVHVEDHPLDYGSFEGTIPDGHYGAGEVILWDRGSWTPVGDLHKGYKKGHLEFELDGEKLKGRWHLVRMADRGGRDNHENWLLMKAEDEAARAEDEADILEEMPNSVKSGQSVEALKSPAKKAAPKAKPRSGRAARAPASANHTDEDLLAVKGATRGLLPDFVAPSLATLVKSVPAAKGWIHEIKLDGYRLQVRIEKGEVKLLTRNGLDWSDRFAPLMQVFAALSAREALLDGEVVVENGNGVSDFSLLQADLSEGRSDRFRYYAFDLLYLDGVDLRRVALTARKARLKMLLQGADGQMLRYSEEFPESGALVLKHACRLSLEGIISKRADSPYRSGRGRDWVKSKCSARQEMVIGGYMTSTVSPDAIGSLMMGSYDDDGKLVYAGKVGTGYDATTARHVFKTLDPLVRKDSPFATTLTAEERRGAVFVEPETVAEIEFRGWTGDHRLRHASFRGLREDKPAREVRREVPAREDAMPEKLEAGPKRKTALTHPDRVYWPGAGASKAGVTKEQLADYYQHVWPLMAPHVVDRPLALMRCPEGIEGQRFFQKHSWRGMRKEILVRRDPKDKEGGDLIGIHDFEGLMALVQGAALEIHPWGSSFQALERPDMVNIDLDPGPDVDWQAVIDAAFEVRRRFEDMGLSAFVKTSGGKGLHVVAPLKPKATWTVVKQAMKALADAMAKDEPDRYVSTVSKAKRHGKILIDYLRNGRGATAVAPYSSRARPGAPVSMPIAWEELTLDLGPAQFTVENVPERIAGWRGDPWADFRARAVELAPVKKGRVKG